MAVCASSDWTITMINDKTQGVLEHMTLKLTIASGVITGTMHYPAGTPAPFSSVSGTCQPLTKPDGTIMTLEFNWGQVDIFMIGFTHRQSFIKFKGRFYASAAANIAEREFDAELAALIPDPGDTGTGTGQQT